jgi:hypothetical protein
MQIDIQQFGNNKVGVLEVTNDEALQIIKSLSSQLRGEDSLDIPRDFRCHGLATELTILVEDSVVEDNMEEVLSGPNGTCYFCENEVSGDEEIPRVDPFADEIHDDHTLYIICDECHYESQQDI